MEGGGQSGNEFSLLAGGQNNSEYMYGVRIIHTVMGKESSDQDGSLNNSKQGGGGLSKSLRASKTPESCHSCFVCCQLVSTRTGDVEAKATRT